MDIKDKVVLITGSSQGIGKETALAFAKEGTNIIITYNKDKKGAEETVDKCRGLDVNAKYFQLDVTDDKSIKEFVNDVRDMIGKIDILVNNAGIIVWKNLDEQTNEEIENQIETNLTGLIKITKALLPYLNKKGIIINISSGAGKTGYSGLTTYCATKFAVRGFTQALANELPDLRVYSVNPGMTATQMTNFQGVPASKVAQVILNTAKENLKKHSGDDIDL